MGLVALPVLITILHISFAATNDFFPRFHVRPPTNWINDPNGPVFYNGVYHLFNQYNPYGPVWGSMSWSHAISLDNIHFAYVNVAMLPDQPYDKDGVFSGSISIIDNVPIIVYTCVGPRGELQCTAVPEDLKDPFLTVWIKSKNNPVIAEPPPGGNTNFRDDTTVWKDGRNYLMGIGAQINGSVATIAVYESSDLNSFRFSNFLWKNPTGGMWECPDFYPISDTKHAAKYSGSGDWITVGTYDPQKRVFSPTGDTTMLDYGQFYASKSFFDSPNNRQIVYGWVAEEGPIGNRNWAGVNSLGRVIVYNPETERIETPPMPEYKKLRGSTISSIGSMNLPSGSFRLVSSTAGSMIEIDAYFSVPSGNTEFGVAVLSTASGTTQTRVGFRYASGTGPMDNTDEPGGDYFDYPLSPQFNDTVNAQNCSSQCEKDHRCLAWTYVRNGFPAPPLPAPRCSLKSSIPNPVRNAKCCISGVKGGLTLSVNRTNSGGNGNRGSREAPIILLPNEKVLRLHVFVDGSIVEAFGQNGRSVIAARVYPTDADATGVALYSTQGGSLINMTVYSLKEAFLQPEDLLAQWKEKFGL